VVSGWQSNVSGADAATFSEFAVRLHDFQQFPGELARIAIEQGPVGARDYARGHERADVRQTLTDDLTKISNLYAARAQRLYTQLQAGIDSTAMMTSLFAGLAVMLGLVGVAVLGRSITRPLNAITRVTEAVAQGDTDVTVPFANRRDEVGALSRAIAVFQNAMRRNTDLNRIVQSDAQARKLRQEQVGTEVERFSADVEATLAELGRICDQMLGAARHLSTVAGDAAQQTARATESSQEASANVRDIASAADELTASVTEIERQVSQSNIIAGKAVDEASRTNAAVAELSEAARRIGDVIKIITDIAAQTNLLALNATIEAARAGDAGKGFAVVAGEVKALAGQTGRATEEIGAQIAAIQHATARSIEAITGIERTIREIGDISSAIAAAVTEQGAATQEIARSVEIAAAHTADTAGEMAKVGSATDATHANANVVKTVADDLGDVAQRIRNQVDQFFQRLSA
jgi:methyl-accepting chemotaxis protein